MRAIKKKRNYKKEYKKFQSSSKSKKNRAARNKRRRYAVKKGKVKKGDGKDIHHIGSKTRIESKSKNRGRKEKSRLKGSKRK
tara:strand:- start:481 stop:726 length:246 start_codon:yes stop_codon:yes gene_type:complete